MKDRGERQGKGGKERENHPLCKNLAALIMFLCERVVSVWNSLPDSVDFSTLSKFGHSIMRIDFSKFLRCFQCHFIFTVVLLFLYIRSPIRLPLVLV